MSNLVFLRHGFRVFATHLAARGGGGSPPPAWLLVISLHRPKKIYLRSAQKSPPFFHGGLLWVLIVLVLCWLFPEVNVLSIGVKLELECAGRRVVLSSKPSKMKDVA